MRIGNFLCARLGIKPACYLKSRQHNCGRAISANSLVHAIHRVIRTWLCRVHQFDACLVQKVAAMGVWVVPGIDYPAHAGVDQHLGAGQAGLVCDICGGADDADAVERTLDDGVLFCVQRAHTVPFDQQVANLIAVRQAGRRAVVTGGQDALDYLFGEGKYTDRTRFPLPSLVLLDLKLPGIDGFEVLRRIKSTPMLKRLPVIILTSSKEEGDRAFSYDNGANSYLVKPVSFDGFLDVVRKIEGYWLALNVAPPGE